MLCLILKHILSHEYGPLDRLLELLVLVAILYEVISNTVRHRRENFHKRQEKLVLETLLRDLHYPHSLEDISRSTGLTQGTAKEVLERLREKIQADCDENGKWHKVMM
jgi:DNA-binding MarR family transcriptional regulator